MALAPAGGDPDVGLPSLARTVDHTAHHRHLDREIGLLERRLGLGGHPDDVDLRPSTRWTGDEIEALSLSQTQVLEQFAPGFGLFHGVGGQREPDGVADPLEQKGADPGHRLDQAAWGRSRLGHPEVERVVDPLRQQAIGGHHAGDVRVLHRDLDVGEVDVLEITDLLEGRLDQRLGQRRSVSVE
jgi:hypothetical protein